MPLLDISYYGNPILKKKSEMVENIDEVKKVLDDMIETMDAHGGVGLAAPQVGISSSFFIINANKGSDEDENIQESDDDDIISNKEDVEVFINPIIHELKGSKVDYEEGCLSVPEIKGIVSRSESIHIEYTDINGDIKEEEDMDGFRAHICQHEYDHLQGILFVEKLRPTAKLVLRKRLKELAEEYNA